MVDKASCVNFLWTPLKIGCHVTVSDGGAKQSPRPVGIASSFLLAMTWGKSYKEQALRDNDPPSNDLPVLEVGDGSIDIIE